MLYMVFMLFFNLKEEFSKLQQLELNKIMKQASDCNDTYHLNECDPATRREGLEQFCNQKDSCRN